VKRSSWVIGYVPARGAQVPRVPPAGDEETDKARYRGCGSATVACVGR
jgi:hypothetical protein